MPLPDGGKTPWPPKDIQAAYDHMAVLSAWYAGDPDQLALTYGGQGTPGTTANHHPFGTPYTNRPSQYRGGLVGAMARWFWGAPTPQGEKRTKLHVPVAGDIAAMSADLLFSEPPTFVVKDEATQRRLDTILTDAAVDTVLLEAAEVAAPLGGVYLAVAWDGEWRDHPFLRAVHADAAVPEWRWGQLAAVTFWQVVEEDGGKCWRHLERHEPGRILHGLYVGTTDQLGFLTELGAHEKTRHLAPVVEAVPKRLTAVYVPNMRPNRLDRSSPMGRSDFAPGTLGLMDALDEVWTSWMRDVRLAKARLIVPSTYMQNLGRGQGSAFDLDRELYETLESLAGADKLEISAQQFAIRVAEHDQTAKALVSQVVGRCGYSLQSFGENAEVAVTATEVAAKERRSFITRDRKIRYFRPSLAYIIETLLAVDLIKFGNKVVPQAPTIEFGDSVSESPQALAQTLQLLDAAGAISTELKVRMLHPDWDDPEVQAEIARIREDAALAQPPPVDDPDATDDSLGADGAS